VRTTGVSRLSTQQCVDGRRRMAWNGLINLTSPHLPEPKGQTGCLTAMIKPNGRSSPAAAPYPSPGPVPSPSNDESAPCIIFRHMMSIVHPVPFHAANQVAWSLPEQHARGNSCFPVLFRCQKKLSF
jgi:hypothetical protein